MPHRRRTHARSTIDPPSKYRYCTSPPLLLLTRHRAHTKAGTTQSKARVSNLLFSLVVLLPCLNKSITNIDRNDDQVVYYLYWAGANGGAFGKRRVPHVRWVDWYGRKRYCNWMHWASRRSTEHNDSITNRYSYKLESIVSLPINSIKEMRTATCTLNQLLNWLKNAITQSQSINHSRIVRIVLMLFLPLLPQNW